MTNDKKRISIILPICNEQDNIIELHHRLKKTEQSLGAEFDVIFVNDGSTDSSLQILKTLAASDKNIKVLNLSRNFGHQLAIRAGVEYVTGDAAVIMDADLQDPPELIEEMAKKWEQGYQVVYAVRKTRKEGVFLRFLYAIFYRLLKAMANTSIPLDSGDFCLLDKSVVKIIASMREADPFMRGLRSWVGFNQIGVKYDREKRYGGRTKYTFFRLVKLALDGIFSFSVIPLRIATFFGFIVSCISLMLIINLVIKRLPVPGTTLIAMLVLFLGGMQLITVGILGAYVGRIYEQAKKRPLFLVKEKINI